MPLRSLVVFFLIVGAAFIAPRALAVPRCWSGEVSRIYEADAFFVELFAYDPETDTWLLTQTQLMAFFEIIHRSIWQHAAALNGRTHFGKVEALLKLRDPVLDRPLAEDLLRELESMPGTSLSCVLAGTDASFTIRN